jgi:hypothetical protein
MRGRYGQYLRGLPGIQPYLRELVRLPEADAIAAILTEIEVAYRGYTVAAEPIRLVNYHENCTL